MTDTKNADLPLTTDALAELSSALGRLSELATDKKQQQNLQNKKTVAEIKNKDLKIDLLKDSCNGIVANIDNIIERLDKVLESNGTSNNNHK